MKFLFLYLAFFICVFGLNAQSSIIIAIHGTSTDISGQIHEVALTTQDPIEVSFDMFNNTGVNHQWRITRKKISVPMYWTDLLCWGHCTDNFGGTCYPADTVANLWTTPANPSVLFDINNSECGKLKVTVNPYDWNTNGQAHYRYYLSDDGSNFSDSVDLVLSYTTALKPVKEEISVNIGPNPAADYVQITMNGVESANLKIMDALGTTISKEAIFSSKKINVSDLRNGVYFLVIEIPGSKTITRKVIIRH
jgi:hypothetical protein